MGVELKTVTLTWDPETFAACDEIQQKFAPFVEGRSQTSRLVFKILRKIVNTQGTVEVLTAHLQDVVPKISSYQPEIQFPAFPEAGKHQEFESLLQQAAVPKSMFPKMAFKVGVVQ
jgi:hypothetical protein